MSIAGRQVPVAGVVFVGLLMIVGAMMPVLTTGQTPRAREIRLVARDMAFYLEDDPATPNPTIRVAPGERVTITMRNDERGIRHDFAVPTLSADLDPLAWGESRAVTFTAPDQAGSYDYVCRPHRLMMRGVIKVVP